MKIRASLFKIFIHPDSPELKSAGFGCVKGHVIKSAARAAPSGGPQAVCQLAASAASLRVAKSIGIVENNR